MAEGAVTAEEAQGLVDATVAELRRAHEALEQAIAQPQFVPARDDPARGSTADAVVTAVPQARLDTLNEQLLTLPEEFAPSEKLRVSSSAGARPSAWAGSTGGRRRRWRSPRCSRTGSIRLTGQDTERGTFAHRHLVLHDQQNGETYAPIQNLPGANASFEVYNSPLSEYGVLGFEYGYSIAAPDALVLWEAQFGDFANGAQIVIDQFVVAGRSKWAQTSRLTLLLRTATRATGRSTRAPASSASSSSARRTTSASSTARRPRSTSTCCAAGPRRDRPAADRDDPEGAASAQGRGLGTRRACRRWFPARARRSLGGPRARTARRVLLGQGLPRHRRPQLEPRRATWPWHGWSSSTRSRSRRWRRCWPRTPTASRSSGRRRSPRTWAPGDPSVTAGRRRPRHRPGRWRRVRRPPWRASPSEGYPTAHAREQDRIVREAGVGAWRLQPPR